MANPEEKKVARLILPPMHYVDKYSDKAVAKGTAPKPPRPIRGTYQMFGKLFNTEESIIRPLENRNIRRLYPHHYDRRRELKKLNQSLLASFLDLLDLLANNPNCRRRDEKVEDLRLLFLNMHHLLNELRVHQARETLGLMMEQQKLERLETVKKFQINLYKVNNALQQAILNIPDTMELDSCVTIDINLPTEQDKKDKSSCDVFDMIMCDIVDKTCSVLQFGY